MPTASTTFVFKQNSSTSDVVVRAVIKRAMEALAREFKDLEVSELALAVVFDFPQEGPPCRYPSGWGRPAS